MPRSVVFAGVELGSAAEGLAMRLIEAVSFILGDAGSIDARVHQIQDRIGDILVEESRRDESALPSIMALIYALVSNTSRLRTDRLLLPVIGALITFDASARAMDEAAGKSLDDDNEPKANMPGGKA